MHNNESSQVSWLFYANPESLPLRGFAPCFVRTGPRQSTQRVMLFEKPSLYRALGLRILAGLPSEAQPQSLNRLSAWFVS
jgi:hypothetical protein